MKTLFLNPRISGALLFGALGGVGLMWVFRISWLPPLSGWLYAALLFFLGAATAAIAGRERVSPWLVGGTIVMVQMLFAVVRGLWLSQGVPLFLLWELMLYGVVAFLGAVNWTRILHGKPQGAEPEGQASALSDFGSLIHASVVTVSAMIGGFLVMRFARAMEEWLFIPKDLYLTVSLLGVGLLSGVCVKRKSGPRWVRWPVQIALFVVLGGIVGIWSTEALKRDPLIVLGFIYMFLLGVLPLIGAWAGMVLRALAETGWRGGKV